MIASIRKAHRIIWIALGLALSLLLIASIAFRHSAPVNEKIPERNIETPKK